MSYTDAELARMRELYANPGRCGLDNQVVVNLIDQITELQAHINTQVAEIEKRLTRLENKAGQIW